MLPIIDPSGVPTLSSVTAPDLDSLLIEWTELDCIERNGIITGYDIRVTPYDEDFNAGDTIDFRVIAPVRMLLISNLSINTPYGIDIRAIGQYFYYVGNFSTSNIGYEILEDGNVRETSLINSEKL